LPPAEVDKARAQLAGDRSRSHTVAASPIVESCWYSPLILANFLRRHQSRHRGRYRHPGCRGYVNEKIWANQLGAKVNLTTDSFRKIYQGQHFLHRFRADSLRSRFRPKKSAVKLCPASKSTWTIRTRIELNIAGGPPSARQRQDPCRRSMIRTVRASPPLLCSDRCGTPWTLESGEKGEIFGIWWSLTGPARLRLCGCFGGR